MLEKLLGLFSPKKLSKFIDTLSDDELRKMYPLNDKFLPMLKKIIDRLMLADEIETNLGKPRKRKVKVGLNVEVNEKGELVKVEKPKRKYTRRYKRNAEGVLEKQEGTEVA